MNMKTRHKVLIVLHSDGFVEAFADKEHIDVETVVMPHSSNVPLAEEYVELTIPRPYREIYFPGNRRAVDQVRTLLPSDIAWQKWNREFLDGLNAVRTLIEEDHKREGYHYGIEFE